MGEKEKLVIKRVRDIELDCRKESKNVVQDITRILKLYSNETCKEIGNRLYDHLSIKYDTRVWHVTTVALWEENLKKSFFSSTTSSNIQRVEVFDTDVKKNVIAYSFDRNDMAASGDSGHRQFLNLYYQMNVTDAITTLASGCINTANAIKKEISGFILNAIPNRCWYSMGSSNIVNFVHHVYCKTSSMEYSLVIFPGGKSNTR